MRFIRQLPAADLAPLVKYYWYFEISQEEIPYTQLCFPYGSFELLYYIKNPNRVQWLNEPEIFPEPKLCFAGQVTRPYVLYYDQSCMCSGISFQPWAGKLFNIPANEFSNQVIPLNEILSCNQLLDDLSASGSIHHVFSQFEIFARELAFRTKTDVQVSNLVKSLCAQPLRTTLHHELGKTNLGRRRLEQRFLESVGISIGSFLKKTRFQLATRLLSSEKTESKLNSLVHEMEYYDQSHFIHEFKQFAGYTPGEYIKNKNGLLDFLGSLTKPSTA